MASHKDNDIDEDAFFYAQLWCTCTNYVLHTYPLNAYHTLHSDHKQNFAQILVNPAIMCPLALPVSPVFGACPLLAATH